MQVMECGVCIEKKWFTQFIRSSYITLVQDLFKFGEGSTKGLAVMKSKIFCSILVI